MVGEMRDHETVEIGLRGALTGHLVLSTLHTNDAVSSATRLLDMGAPGYLVASSLRAIVAQRLLRKLCENCIEVTELNENVKLWLKKYRQDAVGSTFFKGRGCQKCGNTGYKGRMGVFELLELDANMMKALQANDAQAFSAAVEFNNDYVPLAQSALDHALKGLTSIDEVLKLVEVTFDVNEQSKKEMPSALSLEPDVSAKTIGQSQNQPPSSGLSLEDI
jgi:MSHA biogenesis protein MshE